jgi:pilus assembly protein Flp/PilA
VSVSASVQFLQFAVACLRARLGRDERGASLVEYTLLVAMIALACFAAVGFFGGSVNALLADSGSSIEG